MWLSLCQSRTSPRQTRPVEEPHDGQKWPGLSTDTRHTQGLGAAPEGMPPSQRTDLKVQGAACVRCLHPVQRDWAAAVHGGRDPPSGHHRPTSLHAFASSFPWLLWAWLPTGARSITYSPVTHHQWPQEVTSGIYSKSPPLDCHFLGSWWLIGGTTRTLIFSQVTGGQGHTMTVPREPPDRQTHSPCPFVHQQPCFFHWSWSPTPAKTVTLVCGPWTQGVQSTGQQLGLQCN